jgi:hypothetical protein
LNDVHQGDGADDNEGEFPREVECYSQSGDCSDSVLESIAKGDRY